MSPPRVNSGTGTNPRPASGTQLSSEHSEPDRQRQLHALIWPSVPLHELMQELGQLAVLIGAALAQLAADIFGHVPRPTFRRTDAAARRASRSQLKFGRRSAPLVPQARQVNRGSISDSRTSS